MGNATKHPLLSHTPSTDYECQRPWVCSAGWPHAWQISADLVETWLRCLLALVSQLAECTTALRASRCLSYYSSIFLNKKIALLCLRKGDTILRMASH